MIGCSGRVLRVRKFLLSGFVASLGAGGCEPIPQRDSVGEFAQSLYCHVGVPEALGRACARANEEVSVTAGSLSNTRPPLIEADRSAYGIRLVAAASQAGFHEGSVRVRPARSGSYNLYLGTPNLPLVVRGPGGDVVCSCSSTVSPRECNKLRRVNTYALEADHEYRIEVGPTSEARFLRLHLQTLQDPLPYCSAADFSELDLACAAAEAGAQRLDASEVGASSPPEVMQDQVYGVRLTSVGTSEFAGEFSFTPSVTGDYQVYLSTPKIPLAVSGSEGLVPVSCSSSIPDTNCHLLRRGDVYTLRAGSPYRLRLGPNVNTHNVRVAIRRFEAIDECALGLDDCDDEPRACVDLVRGFECRCPGGHAGDGLGPEGCQASPVRLHSVREFSTGTPHDDGSVDGI